jgi:hypothetical protein
MLFCNPMSKEEIIARFLVQQKEAKEQIAQLRAEAVLIAQALRSAALALDTGYVLDPIALEHDLAIYPTVERIREIFREIEDAKTKHERATLQLKGMGFSS